MKGNMDYKIWNINEDWVNDNNGTAFLVDTLAADNIVEACLLARALHPEVQYLRVQGPANGEEVSVEFESSSEKEYFDELRSLFQIPDNG